MAGQCRSFPNRAQVRSSDKKTLRIAIPVKRMPDARAVSIQRAAEFVGLSKWTLYKFVSEGRLQVVRAGRRVLIPMETVDSLLREGLSSLLRTRPGRR